jgi:acetyl esterase/lipase
MGGDNDEMPERYAEASPAFHVSSDDPPVFLYHGKLDFLVTEDQAVDYYETLRAAGVEAELYLHRWRGHMSMFLFGGDAEDKAIAFLSRNNSTSQYITAEHN